MRIVKITPILRCPEIGNKVTLSQCQKCVYFLGVLHYSNDAVQCNFEKKKGGQPLTEDTEEFTILPVGLTKHMSDNCRRDTNEKRKIT